MQGGTAPVEQEYPARRGCERQHLSVGPARAGSFWEGLSLLAVWKALCCVPEPDGSVWDL